MSPLFTYNGKLLIVDGKLAADENCCCDKGFCCRCIGPIYAYSVVFDEGGIVDPDYGSRKPFARISPEVGSSWPGSIGFKNDEGFIIVIEYDGGLKEPVPPGFQATNASYNAGGLACRTIEGLENGLLIDGITYEINGEVDSGYPNAGEWTTDGEKYSICSKTCFDKECCEQCREIDLSSFQSFFETSSDNCGFFISSSNKVCCEYPQPYNENDLGSCLCDK